MEGILDGRREEDIQEKQIWERRKTKTKTKKKKNVLGFFLWERERATGFFIGVE